MYYETPGQFALNQSKVYSEEFFGVDSPANFAKSLAAMPDDWIYRTQKVTYKLNEQEYRTVPFNSIDWSNSIVLIGCSCVFGEGLATEDTISFQVEKATGIPTINLGLCASSMMHALYNQICVLERCPEPLAIVHGWTSYERYLLFTEKQPEHIGPWSQGIHEQLFKNWNLNESNALGYANFIRRMAKTLAPRKYYDFSFFVNTAQALGVEFVNSVDRARDRGHPGKQTAFNAAELIVKNLSL